jgi:spore germination protein GerM
MFYMAVSKRKKTPGLWLIFWLAFIMGITLLFMLNLEKIKGTLSETKVLEKIFSDRNNELEEDEAVELERRIQELAMESETEAAINTTRNDDAAGSPAASNSQIRQESQSEQITTAVNSGSAAQTVTSSGSGSENQKDKPDITKKTVERSVYLMKVDTAGSILWTSVKRDLPATDSPLLDAMQALIKGPSATEEKQGIISLIPKNVKIQNAIVRGSTAYISFNEDFLFNTYGVEGYAGQRRQIVLTATEFSNVKDVQILIDGKPVDYLGESVWIGSPVSRNML